MTAALLAFRLWTPRRYAIAALATAVAAAVTGVPTDLIDTPLFGRQVAVTTWAYPVWLFSALLVGLLVATAARPGGANAGSSGSAARHVGTAAPPTGAAAGGGLLAVLAVGCPVCNKPVLMLLGTAGALDLWAPLQPALGAVALLFLAAALVVRLRTEARACELPR